MGVCWEEKRETEGERRRNRTAITIQDYVACYSAHPHPPPPLPTLRGCVSARFGRKRGNRNPIGGAENIQPFIHPSTHPREREQRQQHPPPPGLPRSVLGFQDRCCPVKVSGSGAHAACWCFQLCTNQCTFTPSQSCILKTCRVG